ncbi:MAG: hypothetical protein WAL63_13655 [Solirubrobacteraceae bacterium]
MIYALLFTFAHVSHVAAGGALTLLFPLILVPIVFGIWWVWLRQSSKKN